MVFLKFLSVGRTSTGESRRRRLALPAPLDPPAFWPARAFRLLGNECHSDALLPRHKCQDILGSSWGARRCERYGMMRGMGPVHRFRSGQEPSNGMKSRVVEDRGPMDTGAASGDFSMTQHETTAGERYSPHTHASIQEHRIVFTTP